jgi:hypothetical protein
VHHAGSVPHERRGRAQRRERICAVAADYVFQLRQPRLVLSQTRPGLRQDLGCTGDDDFLYARGQDGIEDVVSDRPVGDVF